MEQTELLALLGVGVEQPEEPKKRWGVLSEDPKESRRAQQLAALVSLEYFIRGVLKRDRLRDFHKIICRTLESEDLHVILEVPMGHFKTTIALAIWWALPFGEADEGALVELGCGEEWLRWMHRCHDTAARTLIVDEVESLSIKFGEYVDNHYQYNDLFRYLFPRSSPMALRRGARTPKFRSATLRTAREPMSTAVWANRCNRCT